MKTITKISNAQISSRGVQALADKPNATSQYGVAGLTAVGLKQWFDNLATFIANKLNEVIDVLAAEDAAEYIRVVFDNESYQTLDDVLNSFSNGSFARDLLKLYPSATSVDVMSLQTIINSIALTLSQNGESIQNLNELIASGTLSVSDSELNEESTRPIQNKAVAKAVKEHITSLATSHTLTTASGGIAFDRIVGYTQKSANGLINAGDMGELAITEHSADNSKSKTVIIPLSEPLYTQNEIVKQNGKWEVLKRYAGLDLERLNWNYNSEHQIWITTKPSDVVPATSSESIYSKAVCDNYTFTAIDNVTYNHYPMSIAIHTDNNIACYNGSSTSAPSGRMIYELVTPIFIPFEDQTPFYQLESYDGLTYIEADGLAQFSVRYGSSDVMANGINNSNKIASLLLNVAPLLFNNAGSHNAIYRGAYLGSSVTAAQYNAINNGTFEGLYIGDYWTIGGVNYRIAAFDYYLRCGDTDLTTHHAVIVPDTILYTHVMNDSNVTTGGYVGSKMYTEGLEQAKTTIKTAFSGHVLKHRVYLVNATANGRASDGAWYDSEVDLMNEQMVYGSSIFAPVSNGANVPANYGVEKSQLPLFQFRADLISNRTTYWLRDVITAAFFAFVDVSGSAYASYANPSYGVRPAFCIF